MNVYRHQQSALSYDELGSEPIATQARAPKTSARYVKIPPRRAGFKFQDPLQARKPGSQWRAKPAGTTIRGQDDNDDQQVAPERAQAVKKQTHMRSVIEISPLLKAMEKDSRNLVQHPLRQAVAACILIEPSGCA